ncbi:NS4 protein [Acado virus]|nr:NS4 protein [Acado virus]
MADFPHLKWLKRELTNLYPEPDPNQFETQMEILGMIKNQRVHMIDQLLPQMYYYPASRADLIKTLVRQRMGMLKMLLEEMQQLMAISRDWNMDNLSAKLQMLEGIVKNMQMEIFGKMWDHVPTNRHEGEVGMSAPRKRLQEEMEQGTSAKRWC